jgi:hypothetical protein
MTIPAISSTPKELAINKEQIEKSLNSPESQISKEMKALRAKLDKIEEKNKCLRVQFLDWLSDKLLDWSNSAHEMSVRIDSPCIIKVEPRKKEDSKHYVESKEIARLNKLLEEARKGK